MTPKLTLDQSQALPLCAARRHRADGKGRSVRAHRYRSRQQAGLVLEDFAARQGAGADRHDRRRRGGVIREQRDLRIHRGHARWRKTAPAGPAAAGAAPRLDGVRLDDPQRIVGPRDHWRCRDLRNQTVGRRREICARRRGAGPGSVLCRRTFQPGGRGVRPDLSLFRRVRSIDRSLRVRGNAEGTRVAGGAGETAKRSLCGRGRLSRNCCMRFWFATTRTC